VAISRRPPAISIKTKPDVRNHTSLLVTKVFVSHSDADRDFLSSQWLQLMNSVC